MHARKRQERRASKFIFLQKCDHSLCRIFIVSDNILDTASQSCLNSDLIFLVYFNDIRHYTDQTFFTVFVRHNFADTVSVAVITLGNIFKGFQPGRFSVICSLANAQFLLFFAQLSLHLLDLLLIFRNLVIISPDSRLYFF